MSDTQDEQWTIKLVVFNEQEPNVAITFEQTWHGTCTNCGETLQLATIDEAAELGQTHVNTCTPN